MIRPITKKDFEYIYGLYMHPSVNPALLYEWMDKVSFKPIFSDLLKKNIVYIFSEDGQDIGMFKLYPHTYRSSHVGYLGGVAIHPDYGGKGYGVKMMEAILDFAKKENYRRIELSTGATNARAIHLYEKVGFEKEGVLRKYTYFKSENRYADEILMAYIF